MTDEQRQLVERIIEKTKRDEARWQQAVEPPPLPDSGEWVFVSSLGLRQLGVAQLSFTRPTRLDISHRGRARIEFAARDGRAETIRLDDPLADRLFSAIEAQGDTASLSQEVLEAVQEG